MADAKLVTAALGGYVLGRTKKAKAAIRMAMWLSGNQTGPRAMASLQQAMDSPEAGKILEQLKGPVLASAQAAAMTALMKQMKSLSDTLAARTELLNEVSDAVNVLGDQVAETQEKAADALPVGEGDKQAEEKPKEKVDA